MVDREPFNIHDIQPLADNVLLVSARSEYRGTNDFDLNGRVYTRDGAFVAGLLLGDGLETIQATGHGELWAAYLDEGIFGNYGWENPVGAAGLVGWSEKGERLYSYEAHGPVDTISDCYALNVATADDVWFCYYPEFPLVHLHQKRLASTWKVPVAGSHAFAVAAGHALFAGGYEDRNTLRLIRLGTGGKAAQVSQFELLGDGGAIVSLERTIGRSGSLYVLSEGILYETAMSDVLESRHG